MGTMIFNGPLGQALLEEDDEGPVGHGRHEERQAEAKDHPALAVQQQHRQEEEQESRQAETKGVDQEEIGQGKPYEAAALGQHVVGLKDVGDAERGAAGHQFAHDDDTEDAHNQQKDGADKEGVYLCRPGRIDDG